MKKTVIFLGITLLLISSGCSHWKKPEKEKSVEELVTEGNAYYEKERYSKAIKSFETLKDWYPFSKYAVTAEMKIADAYFFLKEYEEAISAYESFENLHPRNEKTPYAIYQIGKCYFVQIDTVDRDQTSAQKALDAYNRLIKNFPDSPYAVQAKEDTVLCYKSLAGNELYVALYYYKTKKYNAALHRFKGVISDYPDVGFHKTALDHIHLCKTALQEKESESDADVKSKKNQ